MNPLFKGSWQTRSVNPVGRKWIVLDCCWSDSHQFGVLTISGTLEQTLWKHFYQELNRCDKCIWPCGIQRNIWFMLRELCSLGYRNSCDLKWFRRRLLFFKERNCFMRKDKILWQHFTCHHRKSFRGLSLLKFCLYIHCSSVQRNIVIHGNHIWKCIGTVTEGHCGQLEIVENILCNIRVKGNSQFLWR